MRLNDRQAEGSLLDLLKDAPGDHHSDRSVLELLADQPPPARDVPVPPVEEPGGPATLDRLERALADARRLKASPDPTPAAEDLGERRPRPPVRERRLANSTAPGAVARESHNSTANASALLSPAALIRQLLRKWYWIALGGVAGATLAAMFSLALPNEYRSVSRIVLEPRGITPIRDAVSPQGLNYEATIAYSQSQVDIIRSISVLGPVVEAEGLDTDPEFVGDEHWLDRLGLTGLRTAFTAPVPADQRGGNAIRTMYDRLSVDRLNQSFVIEIGFRSQDPDKAARIANAITRSYLSSESGAQSVAAQSASTNLTSRLGALREKVAASEERIEAHKRKFGLVETGGNLVDEQSLSDLNRRLALATAQTAEARSTVELARSIDVDDLVEGGLPEPLVTPAMTQARLQYQRSRAALSRLSVKLGERHPQLREAAAEVEAAEDSIREELGRVTAASQRELTRSRSREADLRASVAEMRDRALESNAPKAQLRELERQLDANRRVYENFLQRSRETGEQTAISSRNARVISQAVPPEEKVGPKRTMITLAGGFVGAGAVAFLTLLPALLGGGRAFVGNAPAAPRPPRERSVARRAKKPDDDLYAVEGPAPVPPAAAPVAEAPAPPPAPKEVTPAPIMPSRTPVRRLKRKSRVAKPKLRKARRRPRVTAPAEPVRMRKKAEPTEPAREVVSKEVEKSTERTAPVKPVDDDAKLAAERLRLERDMLAEALKRAREDQRSRSEEASQQVAKAWDDGLAVARQEAAILQEARRQADLMRGQAEAAAKRDHGPAYPYVPHPAHAYSGHEHPYQGPPFYGPPISAFPPAGYPPNPYDHRVPRSHDPSSAEEPAKRLRKRKRR